MKIYIDGKFYDKSNAKISVFDHGLLYGDGVFEGIRAYNSRVFCLDEHLERLYESAHSICLTIPLTLKQMKDAVLRTLRANKMKDAYIRLVVTRGTGDLGLDPRKCKKATVIIITDKIVLYPEDKYRNGLHIITVATRRNIPEALNPRIKSLNYLNNILAKIEVNLAGVLEGLMLNKEGYVAEATGDNVFLVYETIIEGKKRIDICTPPAHAAILEGITRKKVMELARKNGCGVHEKLLTLHDVYTAKECFLTGTAAELIPVVNVDGRNIGSGKPGKITKVLLREFRELTLREGAAIYK